MKRATRSQVMQTARAVHDVARSKTELVTCLARVSPNGRIEVRVYVSDHARTENVARLALAMLDGGRELLTHVSGELGFEDREEPPCPEELARLGRGPDTARENQQRMNERLRTE